MGHRLVQRVITITSSMFEVIEPQTMKNQFIRKEYPTPPHKLKGPQMEWNIIFRLRSVRNHLQNICISYFIFRPRTTPPPTGTVSSSTNIEPKPPQAPGPPPLPLLPCYPRI